jgi:hypothetical protein
MSMVAQPQTIFFHNTQLSIVEHNNQPYVPMKLVVEGMGLDWKSQHRKLVSNPRWGMVKMTIPSSGGIQEMLCIPLRKLFGWFNSISANKVKPECKEAVIKYQEECDDVLWSHWTGKLNARSKAFDELNKIDMEEKLSQAKATLHSHGLHLRKHEKKANKKKRQDWANRNILSLNFDGEGLA